MEKPSVNKFVKPKINTIFGSSCAPVTPATTAKVVIIPSLAP